MSSPPSVTSSIATPPLPQVSIIIPLYNCLPLTQAMFASLQATLPSGLDHQIIFVDDGSTDGTREWLASLDNARIHLVANEGNIGYARANNRGVAVARGRFLVLLNNDLVLLPDWLAPMLETHARLGSAAGVVGNIQLDAQSGAVDHAGIVINIQGKPQHVRAVPRWRPPWRAAFVSVPAVTGACLLIERALWEQLGGFDEGFVNGGEDIDLCFRARAAGRMNAVALRSVVRHHVSASPGRKLRDEENSYRLARRWGRELVAAADHGAHEWCRIYLAGEFADPQSVNYRTALRALAHATRLSLARPREAELAIQVGLAREFERWKKMFADGGGPAPRQR
ncbi:MAG: glycosyltransferase family 2 protein [Opitutaceae bacterium]|nr:glycosyltransferase family 2 protein [Opitutaceae bacterium]